MKSPVASRPNIKLVNRLSGRLRNRSSTIGVMGLGYVGLPLAVSFAQAGLRTVGFEVSTSRLDDLSRGHSYIDDLPSAEIKRHQAAGLLSVTAEFDRLSETDALVICLPTPLGKAHDPDLSILTSALATVAKSLRPGQLIVLSSTTYPGTTEELALPALESSGLRAGTDFFLAYSPERVDPGNQRFSAREIPRVVAGITPACGTLATELFGLLVDHVYQVPNCRTAEMTKLLENTFRSVNIALVNEMAIICRKLQIDVWDVIDAASTKPFGFMRFEPGPGLGGHCIPIDPAYLAWRLRTVNYRARFVELAEDINGMMPEYVANLVARTLEEAGIPLRGSRILTLGLAYKRNVSDARESPAIEIVRALHARGALVTAHDPYVGEDAFPGFAVLNGKLKDELIRSQNCVVILTDHASYDWPNILTQARLVVDSRGVTHRLDIGSAVRL